MHCNMVSQLVRNNLQPVLKQFFHEDCGQEGLAGHRRCSWIHWTVQLIEVSVCLTVWVSKKLPLVSNIRHTTQLTWQSGLYKCYHLESHSWLYLQEGPCVFSPFQQIDLVVVVLLHELIYNFQWYVSLSLLVKVCSAHHLRLALDL